MDTTIEALEAARHELTTLHGLIAADAARPEITWRIDTKDVLSKIDRALETERTNII